MPTPPTDERPPPRRRSPDDRAELLARRALAVALDAERAGAWCRTLAPADPATAERAIELLRQRAHPCATVDRAVHLLADCTAPRPEVGLDAGRRP